MDVGFISTPTINKSDININIYSEKKTDIGMTKQICIQERFSSN